MFEKKFQKPTSAACCVLMQIILHSTALHCTLSATVALWLPVFCFCFLFLFNPLPRVCCCYCCFCYCCWFVYLPHPLSSVEYVFVQWLRLTGLSMSSSHHFHFVCFLMSNKMKNKIYYGAWKTCHGVWCGNGIVYVYMCLCFYFSSPFLGVCVFFFLIGLMF